MIYFIPALLSQIYSGYTFYQLYCHRFIQDILYTISIVTDLFRMHVILDLLSLAYKYRMPFGCLLLSGAYEAHTTYMI